MITTLHELVHRARFAAWVILLRARLARHGARLVLHAPHGARLDGLPHVRVDALGDGAATFTLRRALFLAGADKTTEPRTTQAGASPRPFKATHPPVSRGGGG